MGTLEAGDEPTSRGKATARAQGKAQRLPALHRPPGHRPFRGAPVRPAFALSAAGSPLESGPHRTGREQDKRGLGDGDKEYEKNFSPAFTRPCAPDAAQRVALREAVRCRA